MSMNIRIVFMGSPEFAVPTLRRLAERGQLTARVVGALWWDRYRGAEQIPVGQLNTGDIGLLKIAGEGAVASGVRRVEAVARAFARIEPAGKTGPHALGEPLISNFRFSKLLPLATITGHSPVSG